MKWLKMFCCVSMCFPVFLQQSIAGWDISGSQSDVHQRIVHHPRIHPAPPPKIKKMVHHPKRTYKDYLPEQHQRKLEDVKREPYFEAEQLPSALPVTQTQPVYRVAAPAPLPVYRPNRSDAGGVYAITINGSLKDNITRIMSRYSWKVAWKVPYDYNFDGRVTGSSLPNVIEKLIKPFPLRAVMYMSNRTLAVVPKERIS